ncbi:MAG: glycogen debranching protein GlgX [Desulfobulbaceae bacterium]|nr:glycogen debranching protein GlgX [Desulfobulbaceae bacterium]
MRNFTTSPGQPLPLGVSRGHNAYNFAIFSRDATAVSLLLFASGEGPILAELPLTPEINRTGDIWHIRVHNLDSSLRYGYRVDGPMDPKAAGRRFSRENLLLDPYATALTGCSEWGKAYVRRGSSPPESHLQRRCCLANDDFDWEGDRPLNRPLKDSVIYELHVRGFTRHPSSGVNQPGTFLGLVEKIPYLQELGITAVELLPVTEFDETENVNRNPFTGEKLLNFWGYSPIAFFAPKAAYATKGRNGGQVNEFKEMVKAFHRAGIEVILDIVFNHTGEGNERGPVYSFRGLANNIYYMLDQQTRQYLNFSGCGNTLNCNHPMVRMLIMDCLRHWVIEMHVDGFRFDLASILGRDTDGQVLINPPMIEKIAEDPVLSRTKIIAEAWDAAGLYQVGSFSKHHRWAEWNGRFRDDVRSFMTGRAGNVATLATRVSGSSDLYQQLLKSPFNSINFITSHDGFTLADLVSYERKHNEMNGEYNRDGDNTNYSWNSGWEGETDDAAILALRARRQRSLAVVLLLSQGTPMFSAGDEFGRSQQGNNNAYCQDNEIAWLDWRLAKKNGHLLRFFQLLIRLRREHPVFRRATFFPPGEEDSIHEIRWQSLTPGATDWSPECRTLGFLLDGRAVEGGDNDFLVLLNGGFGEAGFQLPAPPESRRWHLLIDTGATPPKDIHPEATAPPYPGRKMTLAGLGAAVLISKPVSAKLQKRKGK